MKEFWRVKVKVEWENPDTGKVKYRGEEYIVNALNPTDVEAKISEHLKGSDFEIVSISVTNIIDIID